MRNFLVIMPSTTIALAMFIVVVGGFHIDDPRNRDDSALMLKLSPALVQTGLREQSMEAHQGTCGALSAATVFIMFSVTTDTSLVILVRRSVMFRTQRMAMNIVLKIAADENEMSQSTEVRIEIGDRLAIVGEVVADDNFLSGRDWAVRRDRDRISIQPLRH